MGDFTIVNDYPHGPRKVWRALTDPELIPRWTAEGLRARPVGFGTAVGTKFQYVAPPQWFWRGIVDCEVLESSEPSLLRYSWIGDVGEPPTLVTYRLEPRDDGTHFTYEHIGFSGIGGFFVSRTLRRVRARMLGVGLPALLAQLDEDGRLPVPEASGSLPLI